MKTFWGTISFHSEMFNCKCWLPVYAGAVSVSQYAVWRKWYLSYNWKKLLSSSDDFISFPLQLFHRLLFDLHFFISSFRSVASPSLHSVSLSSLVCVLNECHYVCVRNGLPFPLMCSLRRCAQIPPWSLFPNRRTLILNSHEVLLYISLSKYTVDID